MKFCIVGPTYPIRGGIAHYTTLLCRYLEEKHDVTAVTFKRLYPSILFPGKSQIDPSKSAVSFNALPVIDSMNPLTWVAASNVIRDTNPDWTIFQWWQPFFGPCLASIASRVRKHSKVAFICHNVLPHEPMPLVRKLSLTALRHGDGFIVHSNRDKTDLQLLLPDLPEESIRRAYLPDEATFPVSGMTREEARSRLGLKGRVILFFGLVRKYKGLMELIEAMSLVHRDDVTCLVVGEFYDKPTPYLERIKELKLDMRFKVVNNYIPNEDVEQYFAAADVVVLPYRRATQSGIVQIAYHFQRPVIATSVGGLPECIDNERTGLLVPPRDPESLARAIDRYYDEGLETQLVEGIRQDRGRFSWDRVIETIEALCTSV